MPEAKQTDGPIICSFCGKSHTEVKQMIAGPPPANICDECVDLCSDIIIQTGNIAYHIKHTQRRIKTLELLEKVSTDTIEDLATERKKLAELQAAAAEKEKKAPPT